MCLRQMVNKVTELLTMHCVIREKQIVDMSCSMLRNKHSTGYTLEWEMEKGVL